MESSSATIASGPRKYTDRRRERAERRRRAAESAAGKVAEPIAGNPAGVDPASESVTAPAFRKDDLYPDSDGEAEVPVAVSETDDDPQTEVDVTQEVEDVDEWIGGGLVSDAELDEEDVGEVEADETEEDTDDGDYQGDEEEEGYEEEDEEEDDEEEEEEEEEEDEEGEEDEEDDEEDAYEESEILAAAESDFDDGVVSDVIRSDAGPSEDDTTGRVIAESAEEQERVVPISRPDTPPQVALPTPPAVEPEGASLPARRQQKLFGGGVDDGLMEEAAALAKTGRRTTATLLQRKLRIDYELAVQVLSELEARGLLSGGKYLE